MEETFYHVDGHGELQSGDVMELGWPPEIKNGVYVNSPSPNEEVLKKAYPEGLSRHGARYSQSALVTQEGGPLGDGWEIMSGVFKYEDSEDSSVGKQRTLPYQVYFEWIFEYIRRAEFEENLSRFQSYFAWPSIDAAKDFIANHRDDDDQAIFEVRCSGFKRRDMDLVEVPYFGIGLENARKYWKGEPGSDNPNWEMMMEPPVKVSQRVEL